MTHGSNKAELTIRLVLAIAFLSASASRLVAKPKPSSAVDLIDFHHTAWTSESGLGAVYDIRQSPEGYLWLSTSKGVLRFDGVRFESMEEATNGAVRSDDVNAAFITSEGKVLFTTRTAGFLLWDGRRTIVPTHDRLCISVVPTGGVDEDSDGSFWVQALAGLFRVNGSGCLQVGTSEGYPGGLPAAILTDRDGTVWVKAPSGALVCRRRGEANFRLSQYVSGPSSKIAYLHQAPDGSMWLSDINGLRRLPIGRSPTTPSSRRGRPKDSGLFGDFVFGADGSLWATSSSGVTRFDREEWQKTSFLRADMGRSFSLKQGLASNAVSKILVDHEGTVWLATNAGLESLRKTAVTALVLRSSPEHEFGIAVGDHGSIWVGNNSLPLTRIEADGKKIVFAKTRQVTCVRRDRNGTIWSAGEGDANLWHSSAKGLVPVHYPNEKVSHVVALEVDRNNELWINTRPGPTYHLAHGQWRLENDAIGKKSGVLGTMTSDADGNLWLAFSTYLVRWDGTQYQKYSFPPGPLDISVGTMAVHGDHVWLAGRGGVVLFTHGSFRLMQWNDTKLPGRVSGITETETGDLWINGFSGVVHVPADELRRWLQEPNVRVSGEFLEARDGLPGLSGDRFPEPSLVEGQGGRLWFATTKGVAWLDPIARERTRNLIPPPVRISAVVTKDNVYSNLENLTLPAHTENLEIDYTALSLAVPGKVMFRYKLDSVDKDWQEAGTRRQSFYTSLPPGTYRFLVMACNNDGLWNTSGARLNFAIPPTFLQSWAFKALCTFAGLGLLWLVYLLRVRQVTSKVRAGMYERLAERERIARNLHDTFFQGIQGLLLRFHTGTARLPKDEPARSIFEETLRQSDQVMAKGRELVLDLRKNSTDGSCLSDAFAAMGRDFQEAYHKHFKIAVQGEIRQLHSIVGEEVSELGREALYNAFRHSHANSIEVELNYEAQQLCVRFRDDGIGIDQGILKNGCRSGHWGLPGMRERARKIGAHLEIWSRSNAGTEVELRIPASVAYRSGVKKAWLRWLH